MAIFRNVTRQVVCVNQGFGVNMLWVGHGRFLCMLSGCPVQQGQLLGPVHTGRVSTFACKFACKLFDLACKLCEHSH